MPCTCDICRHLADVELERAVEWLRIEQQFVKRPNLLVRAYRRWMELIQENRKEDR